MRVKRTRQYEAELRNIIRYIHQDKPSAAKKFKNDLDKRLIGILENPYMYRASIR